MPPGRPSGAAVRERPPGSFLNTRDNISTPPPGIVPPPLQNTVPYCAQSCLASYISEEYACDQNDIGCLCRHYSSSGFTLGELAFLCLQQECEQPTTQDSIAQYYLCAERPKAVRPTHRTLTVLPAATSSRTETDSTTTVHSTSTTTQITKRITITPTNTRTSTHRPTQKSGRAISSSNASAAASDNANPATMAMSPLETASSTNRAAASNTAAASSSHATGLSSGEAVGVSLGAMGAVVLAIAAVYFFMCFRRRKVTLNDDKKSYDFIDEAPPRFSPFNYGYADPRGPLGGFCKPRVELNAEKRDSDKPQKPYISQPIYQPEQSHYYQRGADFSPESAKSFESMRTISQLLPDKPDPMRPKPPPKSPAFSAHTGHTIFEEDRAWPLPKVKLPGLPSHPKAVLHGLPPHPKAVHHPAAKNAQRPQQIPRKQVRPPLEVRQPPLSLVIPKQPTRSPSAPSHVAHPLHPPPKYETWQNQQQRDSNSSQARSSKSDGSVLNYYASPDAGTFASPQIDSPTPIEAEIQRRAAVPTSITVTKPVHPPRAVRESAGSDTSFESTVDEPTPPEEDDKQLTPVQESPLPEHSPIAGIRYPKVPRSSNQKVSRSPNPMLSPQDVKRPEISPVKGNWASLPRNSQIGIAASYDPVTPERKPTNASTLSGSTLAAKRRGDSVAHGMELNLHHQDTAPHTDSISPPQKSQRSPRQESPLKGYGRVANGRRAPHGTPSSAEMKRSTPRLVTTPGPPGHPQEVVMKSPLWQPKLTPQRRGEDLYLQVGVASPRTGGFTPVRQGFGY